MPPATYAFTRVFEDAGQADFFKETTLPLVKDVLHGQNSLLFAYGATNAGKTYTMQGGSTAGTAGVLPRCIDVLFNSTEGLRGTYKPARLHGVELATPDDAASVALREPLLKEVIGDYLTDNPDVDKTALPVDRNYDYSIWLSYAEVYNEKVYDLLDTIKETPGIGKSNIPRSNTQVFRQALALKTSPPSDDEQQAGSGGKFIAGLRQFHVQNAAEAKLLINLGQQRRRVYGTLANQVSSRSHGMVFIKVLRGHRGEKNDPTSLQVSRLTLVDLAGSERTKYTHTSGDRLKEAGNINNSLMVLGQCLETIRSNQKKYGMSLSSELTTRVDSRDVKRTLAIVPFTHSKLTLILSDYFVGDGRTVMIVNVNPSDTSYDENSHVMKFAALARDVRIAPAPAPVQKAPMARESIMASPKTPTRPRKVTLSLGGAAKEKEAIIEVTELDELMDTVEEEDDYPQNPLVNALFEEIERLRLQLWEMDVGSAAREAEVRREVVKKFEKEWEEHDERNQARIQEEVYKAERRFDAKLEFMYKSGAFDSPRKAKAVFDHSPVRKELTEDDGADSDMSPPPSPTRPKFSRFASLEEGMAALGIKTTSPFLR
ncbi:kinesin-domain-containing protein [Cylindrobasidium torrendii FP15055 ss-10]|uniref:Kinesin-like protein n=1 Tax=Cylindrobasidium torrendii FP15055 ss-10 TaxID=1314674 RepID=A0A0D7BD60_9AGAR|nr:kinesin-domain-containing protein [Cylindrobasidium torrendii FP15055 ss-10]